MIINEINIQNFKSFGNNKQTIKFEENGQLILMCGKNGNGKSSILESIDFSLYGLVRGKEKKRIPLTELPNRINDSLLTSIKFINNNNNNITIERGLKPNKLKVILDSNDITSNYKKYTQDDKEDIIGMNYEIYKSFISMSLNDFTNFINLNPETKRKLLNKLFNLEELDNYSDITKNIIRNNNKIKEELNYNLLKNKEIIDKYKKTIENINIINYDKEDIKNQILSNKSIFLIFKNDITEINHIINELNNDLINKKNVIIGKNREIDKIDIIINEYDKKIKIFNSGKCPICNTNLKNHEHLNVLIDEKDILIQRKNDFEYDLSEYKKEYNETYLNKNNYYNELKIKKIEYNKLNDNLIGLKKDYNNCNKNKKIIEELENNLIDIENKNNEISILISEIKLKNKNYNKLYEIFSNNGIRKDIIKNTIIPLNNYLSNYLKELNSNFKVILDNDFNTKIYERQINEINSESLSSGESRKINMALALSYLEIIRNIKKSNILFLDEIFANIDSENIDILLKTLKKFALKYGINIIIIAQDHTPFNIKLFDRIINIKKNIFSMIEESN
jgi:DNA repair exonuclease SbcCD ATPase subunit